MLSPYGLSGSIWTNDLRRALRVAKQVGKRRPQHQLPQQRPRRSAFGGYKQSGIGRDLGMTALDGYTELKNVYVAKVNLRLVAGNPPGECSMPAITAEIKSEAAVQAPRYRSRLVTEVAPLPGQSRLLHQQHLAGAFNGPIQSALIMGGRPVYLRGRIRLDR